jgi:hypothetical protein
LIAIAVNEIVPLTARPRIRWLAFAAMLLVLAQAAIGMVINLDVVIPSRHPGAHADFFGGSFHSVIWAIAHGGAALAIHALLGLFLAVIVLGVAIHAVRLGDRTVGAWSSVATLFVIGAGFNGASFLDYNHDVNSLIMALLAFAAIACYSVVMFHLAAAPRSDESGRAARPTSGVVEAREAMRGDHLQQR